MSSKARKRGWNGRWLLFTPRQLCPEEAFGLKWADIEWKNGQIHISRAWAKGKETLGKNKGCMTQVVMHPVLATALRDWRHETLYHRDTDWIFASVKAKGRIPRSACKLAHGPDQMHHIVGTCFDPLVRNLEHVTTDGMSVL